MSFNSIYMNQVDLLLDVLPTINQFDCFALKGGTAINLFIRDMPRLSVDIDLTYLPLDPRESFLQKITSEIQKMKHIIEELGLRARIIYNQEKQASKLTVENDKGTIKIEPNFIIRGSAFPCQEYELCQKAQDQFLKYSRVKTLSFADVYGGKICAALDRQHPRDLFDVKILLDNQELNDTVRQAFIVYLISSPRPIHELLNPNPSLKNFDKIFDAHFQGMTDYPVSHKELQDTRHQLIRTILQKLTDNEKHFLLSLKSTEPQWSLIPIPHIDQLPAVQWKVINLKKMNEKKRMDAFNMLKHLFNQI